MEWGYGAPQQAFIFFSYHFLCFSGFVIITEIPVVAKWSGIRSPVTVCSPSVVAPAIIVGVLQWVLQ